MCVCNSSTGEVPCFKDSASLHSHARILVKCEVNPPIDFTSRRVSEGASPVGFTSITPYLPITSPVDQYPDHTREAKP
jgi:hypothetical protein